MSPSTNPPQRAFRRPDPGHWRCLICVPTVEDKAGQSAWMAHYCREHYRPVTR